MRENRPGPHFSDKNEKKIGLVARRSMSKARFHFLTQVCLAEYYMPAPAAQAWSSLPFSAAAQMLMHKEWLIWVLADRAIDGVTLLGVEPLELAGIHHPDIRRCLPSISTKWCTVCSLFDSMFKIS